MSNGYLIISADCHAGPDSPRYREYLDPQYRDRFDAELGQRDALMEQMRRERFGTDAHVFAGREEVQEGGVGGGGDGKRPPQVGVARGGGGQKGGRGPGARG